LQSTELLYDLVDIPSTSTHEHDISLFVEEMLRDLGMEIMRSGNNLIGKLGREGPVLALCGHLDTVPPFFPAQNSRAKALREGRSR